MKFGHHTGLEEICMVKATLSTFETFSSYSFISIEYPKKR